jgi:acetyl esterase/lipase
MAKKQVRGYRLLVLLALVGVACAHQSEPLDPGLGIVTIPLYGVTSPAISMPANTTGEPTLTVFTPQPGLSNGSAVIVAPGGAYLGLSTNLEGRQVADWFAARGVTAFMLKYRLGPQNPYPIPLLDAQRAIRLVRSLSTRYGLAQNRVGIVGFSAGGHLAAETATNFRDPAPSSDPIDQLTSRPDFVVLAYPWLNAMEPSKAGEITYCSMMRVLSAAQCASLTEPYTPKLHISSETPPVFLYATSDDSIVPVRASVELYNAMIAAGADVEMHLFRHGAHGLGLGAGDPSLDQWPTLLESWLRDRGILSPPSSRRPSPGQR